MARAKSAAKMRRRAQWVAAGASLAALICCTLAGVWVSELSQPHASSKARLRDNNRARPKRTNISITNSFQCKT